jgi:hypothetical protein
MNIDSMKRCVDHRILYRLPSIIAVHRYAYPLLTLVSQRAVNQIILHHWDDIRFDLAVFTVGKIVRDLDER